MALEPDVTALLDDSDLGSQGFTVRRRTIKWIGGRAVADTDTTFTAYGIMQPASPEQLSFFPEGERSEGMIVVYTRTMLHITEDKDVSDVVTWHDENYKLIRVDRWDDYGFCVAYAQVR